jgi:putative NADPH-quinone reductase
MNILVILGHPNPESFNHAIAQTVCQTLERNGHRCLFHDLYAEGFDPLMTQVDLKNHNRFTNDPLVEQHCDELKQADGIIIIHPNWWGMPPAILKGWVDRVIRTDVAYCFEEKGQTGEGEPIPLLEAKFAVVFNTSDTALERELEVFGDPLETLWRNCIFGFCGIDCFERKTFTIVVTSTREQRVRWLDEVEAMVNRLCPEIVGQR